MNSETNCVTNGKKELFGKQREYLGNMDMHQIRSKSIRFILLNMIGYVLAISNIYGFNPIGPAFFMAMCINGCGGIISIVVQLMGISSIYGNVDVAKYGSILFAIYAITKIISVSSIKINKYIASMVCFCTYLVMEVSSLFMDGVNLTANDFKNIYMPLVMSLFSAVLVLLFTKSVDVVNSRKSFLNNEDMFSIALVMGMVIFNMGINYNFPGEIINIAIYLSVMYGGYKYGSGMGGVLGAACGITFSIWENNPSLLGVMCITGIIAGTFRELGRLFTVVAVMCVTVTAGYSVIPFFIEESVIKGMLGAAVIFLALPKNIVFRFEENISNSMQKKVENICEEKLLNVAKAFEKLSNSIINVSEKKCDEMSNEDEVTRMNQIWKNKFDESRVAMSKQLQQISQIIEEYSKEVYDLVNISSQQEEYIVHKMKMKKMTVNKIAGIENKRHKREFLVTAKCERGMTIGTREIAEIISEAMGKTYMPARNCRKVLTSEFTTTNYVEEANFYVLHAAAKRARGNNGISGDNYSFQELENGQLVMSLSDGMGYGTSACLESETVIDLLEQLLDSGFSEDTALRMINSVMLMNSEQEHPATLDFGVINLHSGVCDIVKIGAASTFVKRGNWVENIKSTSMPLGMFGEVDYDSTSKKLYDGDMVIMVSDGVIDAIDSENKDKKLGEIIMGIESTNPKEIANEILEKAVTNKSVLSDDMTVLVTGIWDNKRKSA